MNADAPPWNVLVTSQEGYASELLRELKPYGRFRLSSFRNVLVGEVEDRTAFLDAVAGLCRQRPFVATWLGKVLPIDDCFSFAVDQFADMAAERLRSYADQVANRTFHVRVERRGHKRLLNTHQLEKRLGESVFAALEARGLSAKVKFDDPDVVLAVEILGDTAGIGAVSRELRSRYPFVKID